MLGCGAPTLLRSRWLPSEPLARTGPECGIPPNSLIKAPKGAAELLAVPALTLGPQCYQRCRISSMYTHLMMTNVLFFYCL